MVIDKTLKNASFSSRWGDKRWEQRKNEPQKSDGEKVGLQNYPQCFGQ